MKSERINAEIHSEKIQLDQLIKWLGLSETGGQARTLIDEGKVKVNGNTVFERRKKIVPGDIVLICGNEYLVVSEDE
jgi:ribosome-associated protein